MANLLAAIGRGGRLSDRLTQILQLKMQRDRMQSESAMSAEVLKEARRKNLLAKQEEDRLSAHNDWKKKKETHFGGAEGAYSQHADKWMRRKGYLDLTYGGEGQVQQRHLEEYRQYYADNPLEVKGIHLKYTQDLYKQRTAIDAELKEKPDDKKLLEQKQNIGLAIDQATKMSPGIEAGIERAAEIKKAEVAAAEKAKAAKKIADAKRVHQIAERLIKEQKTPTEITPTKIAGKTLSKWLDNKELSDKEKKILDKHFSKSGDTSKAAYDKTRQRLKAKVDEFEALVKRKATVGEIRRMFFADIYGILEPEEKEATPTEGKAVPVRLKDESLEDYLKRVSGE